MSWLWLLLVAAIPAVIALLPRDRRDRICPTCREVAWRSATRCPHCTSPLTPTFQVKPPPRLPSVKRDAFIYTAWGLGILAACGFGAIGAAIFGSLGTAPAATSPSREAPDEVEREAQPKYVHEPGPELLQKWTLESDAMKRADAEKDRAAREALRNTPTELQAASVAKSKIRDVLASPSAAEFPWAAEARVEKLGFGRFRVSSYVDAENGFGATIRTRYTITLRHLGGDTGDRVNWILEDLETTP